MKVRSICFAFVLLLGLLPSAVAAQIATPVEEQRHREEVDAIAASLSGIPDRADEILESMSFRSEFVADSNYVQWPALRKIEAAYLSAVAHGGNEEGERFLTAFTHEVAKNHAGAIRHEPRLRRMFDADPIERTQFASLVASQAVPDVPLDVRLEILTLEKYVDVIPGGMQSAMTLCCNLSEDLIYKILREASSRADALNEALALGNVPPELRKRLVELLRSISENTRAVDYETALAPLFQEMSADLASSTTERQSIRDVTEETPEAVFKNSVTSDQTERPSGGSFFGDSEANRTAYLEQKKSTGEGLPKLLYRTPGGGYSHYEMISTTKGFGGVVFGAEVTSDVKVEEVWWVKDSTTNSKGWGHFQLLLNDKTITSTQVFKLDDVLAARDLIRGKNGVSEPLDLSLGEGIGLASQVNVEEFEMLMVVHPALYDREIGSVAAKADQVPLKEQEEINGFSNCIFAVGSCAFNASELIFARADHGWYKVADVPIKITRAGGQISFERSKNCPNDEMNDDDCRTLRKLAFVTFYSKQGEQNHPESHTAFYEMVPKLIQKYEELERLNEFAKLFALMRWIEKAGARMNLPEPDG
jgi:hypothetical protein